MSKVSAMQAMREARYAAARTRPSIPAAAPVSPARPPAAAPPVDRPIDQATDQPTPEQPETGSAVLEEALCGHRSMNNRSCRRPAGHPEKNHRYN